MKTERILVIGDPHFREGSVREMELFIEESLQIVTDNKELIDYVVVLGDVMDRHGILHQKPFHQSCRFLIELAKILPTYCLIGNHDFDIPSKYLPENHPYKVMTWTDIPGLTIVDKPRVIDGKLFTPYVPPGMFDRAISDGVGEGGWEALVRRDIGLVFAHQEFRGCQMGRLKSETGDPWPETDFGKVPFVISGHIHDHQMVGENVLYVGTPVQVNYGEGVKKGLCLVTMVLDPLPVSYELKWFPIHTPKKVTKTVSVDQLESWVQKQFENLVTKYKLSIDPGKKGKDFIAKLYSNKDNLEHLYRALREDKHADQLRLQVTVESGKVSNTVLKNTINKIKDLPLGVNQVFITELFSKSEPELSITPEERKSWMDLLLTRVSNNEPKRQLLSNVLEEIKNRTN